uniref:Major sperm protein n=2 Tax=Panagrellus redivivus TaxID=6233 RepID=A0A7E4UME2_PANRE
MAKAAQILRIEPNDQLPFTGPFTEVVTSKIRLENPTDKVVYFKVKTTAPKHYCVRPNSGLIKPSGSADISVLLQPVDKDAILEREGPRHKFMIQSAVATDPSVPVDEFWKKVAPHQIMDSKLRVHFNFVESAATTPVTPSKATTALTTVPPPKDQSKKANVQAPVSQPAESGAPSTGSGTDSDLELRKRYNAENSALERENRNLKEELSKLARVNAVAAVPAEPGMPTIQVVLLAFAMLLIGLILGKMF